MNERARNNMGCGQGVEKITGMHVDWRARPTMCAERRRRAGWRPGRLEPLAGASACSLFDAKEEDDGLSAGKRRKKANRYDLWVAWWVII